MAKSLQLVIVAKSACGICESTRGEHCVGDEASVFTRDGVKAATCFNFQCRQRGCHALCGVTTCALPSPAASPRHLVSKFIGESQYFLSLRKPFQRRDACVGYTTALLEEMTNHAATHKTFDGFVVVYNLTAFSASKVTGMVHKKLDPKQFSSA